MCDPYLPFVILDIRIASIKGSYGDDFLTVSMRRVSLYMVVFLLYTYQDIADVLIFTSVVYSHNTYAPLYPYFFS